MSSRIILPSLLFVMSAGAWAQNPCQDKPALVSPVLAIVSSGHEGTGIGGTGHTSPTPPTPQLPAAAVARLHGGGGEGDGMGGTGIVGVINGFGSLCVAGHEIHYDAATPVQASHAAAGTPGTPVFGLGQMVSIRALPLATTGDPASSHVATEIRILHEVHGPVESVAADGSTFRVLGQQIQLGNGATLEANMQGVRVAVSGYRLPDGSIQASRVERDGSLRTGMIGTVEAIADQTTLIVSGQTVKITTAERPAIGREISVEGVMRHGVLVAESWQMNPRFSYAAPVERLLLQGHVRWVREGTVNLEGVNLHFPDGSAKFKPGESLETLIRVDPANRMDSEKWTVEPAGSRVMPSRTETSGRPDAAGRADVAEIPVRQEMPVRQEGLSGRPDIPQRYHRIELIRPERMGTFSVEHPVRPPDRPGIHR